MRIGLYIALASTAVWFPTLFPFVGPPHWVFRLGTSLSLVLLVCSWSQHEQTFKRTPLLLPLSVWIAFLLLSTALCDYPKVAFWGTLGRDEGAFQQIHYLAFYVCLTAVMRIQEHWRALFRFNVGVSMVVLGWGVLPWAWTAGRLHGSTPNATFLGVFLLFSIWQALELARTDRRWLLSVLPLLGGLVLAQSRGAWLGLALGTVCFVVFHRPNPHKTAFAGALTAIGLLTLVSTTDLGLRGVLWDVGAQSVAQKPLGWGPGGFAEAWDLRFPPDFAFDETWHDRAHNSVLDRALEGGVFGAGAWLWALFLAFRTATPLRKSVLIGYFAASMVSFDTLTTMMPLMVLLAYDP